MPRAPAARVTAKPAPAPAVEVEEPMLLDATAEIDPLVGTEPLGQYRIMKRIGAGGFGAVYLAEQLGVGRKAVIKVLHRNLCETPEFLLRFEREAAVLAKLDHHHIVRLYNFGDLGDGQLYLAMEWGGDRTLADEITARGRLSPERALLIGEQVCQALQEAHAHGVVHRDLKPANILLGSKGAADWAKVVDVGIARLVEADESEAERITRTGAIIGTPAYFSPEQARGLSVDGRSDLYSLAVVIYEMLTGKLPVEGATPIDFVRAHNVDPPMPFSTHKLQLPPGIESAVMRALEKDPQRRYKNAVEMEAALSEVRNRLGKKPARRSKVPLIAAAGGIALALGIAAVAFVAGQKQAPPPVRERPPRQQVQVTPPAETHDPPAPPPQKAEQQQHDNEKKPAEPARHTEEKAAPAAVTASTKAEPPPRRPPPKPRPAPAAEPEKAPATPADALAQRLLDEAAASEKKHDGTGAIRQLERAVALQPSNAVRAKALRALADLHYGDGNSRRALETYRKVRPLVGKDAALEDRIRLLEEEVGQ